MLSTKSTQLSCIAEKVAVEAHPAFSSLPKRDLLQCLFIVLFEETLSQFENNGHVLMHVGTCCDKH